LSLALVGGACGGEEEKPLPAGELRIATGLDGGVYRLYGRSLATVINRHLQPLRATALTTDGSVENLQLLDRRQADIGFTLADTAGPALSGAPPFAQSVRISALARLYDDYVQVIARADSRWSSVMQLAGRRISIGAPRSGTALTAARILKLRSLGLRGSRAPRISRLPLRDSADALAADKIDAFFWSGGLPTDAVAELRKKVNITLLDLPSGTAAVLDSNLFTETQLPRNVYGGRRPVRTVAAANLLVVRQDMPEEMAFRLTRLLFEHQPEFESAHEEAQRLNRRKAIATYPLDLHPGAERYYRQARP
jgi:TRAP transporter TAXI family solute receptor